MYQETAFFYDLCFAHNIFTMPQSVKCHVDCNQCQTIALSIFSTLKKDELEELNQHKTSLQVKKGSVIFYENNMPLGFYCVHQGKVKVYKTASNGDIQIIRLATDGKLIGYRSLLANEPYQATAETIEDSTICFIPKSAIMDLIAKNLDFSLRIMEEFAQDLDFARKQSLNILTKNSRERLAEAIILLHKTFGTTPAGYINVKLTRAELASITGMVHETVVRILTEWEKDGLIMLDKKLIKISNFPALMQCTLTED